MAKLVTYLGRGDNKSPLVLEGIGVFPTGEPVLFDEAYMNSTGRTGTADDEAMLFVDTFNGNTSGKGPIFEMSDYNGDQNTNAPVAQANMPGEPAQEK